MGAEQPGIEQPEVRSQESGVRSQESEFKTEDRIKTE
jgi:hypothetical protein